VLKNFQSGSVIIIPYIFLYYIKGQFGWFYGKFAGEGDILVDNTNIYNVEGTIGVHPVYNPLQPEVFWNAFLPCGCVIVFAIPEIILLSPTKQNIHILKYIRVVSV
jgi:hypothetical protein